MRFVVVLTLLLLTISLSFWNFFPRGKAGPAAVQVFSKPAGAPVFLNDSPVGVTPYKNQDLVPGDIKIAIGTGSAQWIKQVKLNSKVFTIINRELTDNTFQQAGEVLNLEPGSGLVIFSIPDGSQVEVDDKPVGQTPLNFKNLSPGQHKVVILKKDYLSRAIQVQTHPNHRLVLEVTLASTSESLDKILGPTYTQPTAALFKLKILPTPTGFLRVREDPSFQAREIAQLKPGEELTFLEEKPNWFKIRLTDGRQGWISSQYAQKL